MEEHKQIDPLNLTKMDEFFDELEAGDIEF